MKKLFIIFVLLLTLTGCRDNDTVFEVKNLQIIDQSLNWEVSSNFDHFNIYLDNQKIGEVKSLSFDISSYKNGIFNFSIEPVYNNKRGKMAEVQYVHDDQPPVLTDDIGYYHNKEITVRFNDAVTPITRIEVVFGELKEVFRHNEVILKEEGVYVVTAYDLKENYSTFEFTIDYTKPAVVFNSTETGVYTDWVEVLVQDDISGLFEVSYTLDNIDYPLDHSGSYLFSEPGTYTLSVKDKAGNYSTTSFEVVKTPDIPTLSIDGKTLVIKDTSFMGDYLIYINDLLSITTKDNTIDLFTLPLGIHSIKVVASYRDITSHAALITYINNEHSTPQNLKIEENRLIFDEIDNADHYVITTNELTFVSKLNQFNLSILDNGTYLITVQSYRYGQLSSNSSSIEFVLNRDTITPTLKLEGKVLSWENLYALSYDVHMNDKVFNTTDTSLDLDALTLDKNQSYWITVEAILFNSTVLLPEKILYHNYESQIVLTDIIFYESLKPTIKVPFDGLVSAIYIDNTQLDSAQYNIVGEYLELYPTPVNLVYNETYSIEITTNSTLYSLEVTYQDNVLPYLLSNSNQKYANSDVIFTFDIGLGSFDTLSGTSITIDDYTFIDGVLTIKNSYIERLLDLNPTRKSLILTYSMKQGTHTSLGNLLISLQ